MSAISSETTFPAISAEEQRRQALTTDIRLAKVHENTNTLPAQLHLPPWQLVITLYGVHLVSDTPTLLHYSEQNFTCLASNTCSNYFLSLATALT